MKLLKLKVPNCASCLYSDIVWHRHDGDTVICNIMKDKDGHPRVAGDGQTIPSWCPLEDVKE